MSAVAEVLAPEYTEAQARKATDKAKTHVTALWEALAELRERQAHKALGYKSWEVYCDREFDITSRSRADQLAAAGLVRRELATNVATLPASEAVSRELVPYLDDPTAIREIWERSLAINESPTAAQVKSVVKSWANRHGELDAPASFPRPTKPFDLIAYLEAGISKIQAENPKKTTGAAALMIKAGIEEILASPVTPGI